MEKLKGKIKMHKEYYKMKVEFFVDNVKNIEELQNEINDFVNDLQEDGLKCFDIQFQVTEEGNILAMVSYGDSDD